MEDAENVPRCPIISFFFYHLRKTNDCFHKFQFHWKEYSGMFYTNNNQKQEQNKIKFQVLII